MEPLAIRPAVPEDAPQLALIQTESWKAAFAGILTAETLTRCTDLPRCEEMLRGAELLRKVRFLPLRGFPRQPV